MQLNESQVEEIAELAAKKAVAMMTAQVYQEVGKTVIRRFFFIVGLIAVGVIAGVHFAKGG